MKDKKRNWRHRSWESRSGKVEYTPTIAFENAPRGILITGKDRGIMRSSFDDKTMNYLLFE